MTTRAINNEVDQHTVDDAELAAGTVGIDKDYERALKGIRNDVEQIREIDQSLAVVSRETVDELINVLQLNNKVLRLENFAEGREILIYPKGLVLIRDIDGDIEPKPLVDLEPPFLYAILKQLIPKLKESLDDKKRADQNLLEELAKVRESLV